MKRTLMTITFLLFLICVCFARADGLLPSLVDTIGKPMPSLGEALGRYPEMEIHSDDGKKIELFSGVTEADFTTFSIYLSEKGAVLNDYQTAGSSFTASIQMDDSTITFTYDMQTLEASITYSKETYDEWLDYAKTQFKSAVQMIDAGNTDEALEVLFSIPNYSEFGPLSEYLEVHPEIASVARKEKLAPFRTVGGYVTFGRYEQDNNAGNGKEPIEWLILDYDSDNNRALLLSRYCLVAKPYNIDNSDITWEKCTLRIWLNGEFLNNAFNTVEQGNILTTVVDNSDSQGYSTWSTNGGNNTQDKVFLLSYAEANKYLDVTYSDVNNTKSRAMPTPYAITLGGNTSNKNMTADGSVAGWWWLRSPGDAQSYAARIRSNGTLNYYNVSDASGCVRPSLWIDLESDIF